MDESVKKAIAVELDVDPVALTSQTALESTPKWDSVTALTLMVIISDAVRMPIDPSEIAQLKTFGDIETLMSSKIK